MMRPESIAREEEVFGSDFVEHFGGTREHEVNLWNAAVTNWEGRSSLSDFYQETNFPFAVERYIELV